MVDQDLVVDGLEPDVAHVEIEVREARRHLPGWLHDDLRDVDGSLDEKLGCPQHDSGDVGLLPDALDFLLLACPIGRFDLSDHLRLHLGLREVSRSRESLKLLRNLERDPCDPLLLGGLERNLRLLRYRSAGPSWDHTAVDDALDDRFHLYALLPLEGNVPADDDADADDRVGAVCVVDDLLEAIVSDDGETVHRRDTDALAVREAQTAADRLLDERPRVRRAERDDRVEVRDVPALLEHVDVDDD